MGISNLHEYSKAEYDSLDITSFDPPMEKSQLGNPDDKVSILPQGWVGERDFAFKIKNDAKNASSVRIDNLAKILIVDVVSDSSQVKRTTYWTVDAGLNNGSANDWSMTYEVERNGKKTGKWVFDKGINDDSRTARP